MFDYQSALKSGANPDDIIKYLAQTRGYDYQGALKAGASKTDLIEYLSNTPKPAKVEKKSVTDSALNVYNKAWNAFVNAPGIKQASSAVGNVVGAAGGAIGGLMGAIGQSEVEGIKNTKNLLTGNKVDLGQSLQNIKNVAVSTGKTQFSNAQQVGQAAVPAAVLGGLGRLPNAIVAAGQTLQGVRDIKTGIKDNNTAQALQGGLSIATGLLGAKNTLAKGKQGLLVNPKVPQQLKSEVNFLTGGKLLSKTEAKAASAYRNVINPTKGEITNLEIRGSKDINDATSLMAKEGLILKTGENNKLDTRDAIDQLWQKSEPINTKLHEILKANPADQFNMFEWAKKANDEIKKSNLSASEKKSLIADVTEIIDDEASDIWGSDYKKLTPEKAQALGVGLINGEKSNAIKQGLWKMGYNQMKPTAQKVARKLGYIIKDDISQKYPDVKPLNDQLSKYATASQLLQNAHGRVIKGGAMGGHFAGLAGAIVGNSINMPVIGPIAGNLGGKALSEYINSPERITTKYAQKLKSKPLPPSILAKTKNTPVGLSIKDVSTADDSLMAEARKYKSAEAFVKAQRETLYHGTSAGNKFETFDLKRAGSGVGSNAFDQGDQIYLTSNKKAAEFFSTLAEENNILKKEKLQE